MLLVTPDCYQEIISRLRHLKSSDHLAINCVGCGLDVTRKKSKIQAAIKHGRSLFCSAACAAKSRAVPRLVLSCDNCGEDVLRREADAKGKVFCNSSCSATYNNTLHPKRTKGVHYVNHKKVAAKSGKSGTCYCGKNILSTSKQCSDCRIAGMKEKADEDYLSKTFGQFKEMCNNVSHEYYVRIRTGARRLAARRGLVKVCRSCGYDTYVELCHIKNISSFPDEATMEEINDPKNLVYLCPNHHKELDLGLLRV